MKYPLISEILHLAADKYLAVDYHDEYVVEHFEKGEQYYKEKFSCIAIGAAMAELTEEMEYPIYRKFEERVFDGLENMGCDTDSTYSFRYSEEQNGHTYSGTIESQQARYFWLKWAALMAEEQGI